MAPLRRLIDDFLDPEQAPRSPEMLHHRMVGISRLLDVTTVLAAEIEPSKILETITAEARKALHCERATLYRFDAERQELWTSVVTELELSEIRRPVNQGVSGYAATQRRLVNVPDPARDPRWSDELDQLTGFHTRNLLVVPLIAPNDGGL